MQEILFDSNSLALFKPDIKKLFLDSSKIILKLTNIEKFFFK